MCSINISLLPLHPFGFLGSTQEKRSNKNKTIKHLTHNQCRQTGARAPSGSQSRNRCVCPPTPPSPWLLSALLHPLLPVHKPLCQMPQSHPTAQEGVRQVHLSGSQSLVLKGRGRGQSTTENDEASDRKSVEQSGRAPSAASRGLPRENGVQKPNAGLRTQVDPGDSETNAGGGAEETMMAITAREGTG